MDTVFSGGMTFADGGTVVENKMLSAVIEQGGFLAAFTGKHHTRRERFAQAIGVCC